MQSWLREKPTDADARRMNLRGHGTKTLKVEALSLAEALALARPQVKPKTPENIKVVAVSPRAIEQEKASKHQTSGAPGWILYDGVLYPPSSPIPYKSKKKKPSGTKKEILPKNAPQLKRTQQLENNDKTTKPKKYAIDPYDCHSHFEGGFRIVQGGLMGRNGH
jgi:hypothetical protein